MADFPFKRARFWKRVLNSGNTIICELCPRQCHIAEGKSGFCCARKNISGELYSFVYGYPAALQVDPIEKKPFSMFMKGTYTFSIGTYGCNLDCSFCQNFHLSRGIPNSNEPKIPQLSPTDIIKKTLSTGCKSVAFTYNEPTIWAEYAIDIALEAKKHHIPVLLVSNGFISRSAMEEFYPLIDAANIDMKGFSEEFYSTMAKGNLQNVLESIKYLYKLGKHIELTNLIIPGKNDSESDISHFLDWVEKELDTNIPIHFSAYFPTHKYFDSPRTPRETLFKIKDYAHKRNFPNIFLGNI